MAQDIRILIVEDSEDDALLMLRELQKGGFQIQHLRVDRAEPLRRALHEGKWDIVIADYAMPHFSGLEALRITRMHAGNIPFILVSGKIDEQTAVEAIRAGANDYIVKDHLPLLGPAVRRELRQVEARGQRRRTEEALREQEARLRSIYLVAPVGIGLVCDRILMDVNDRLCRMTGYSRDELTGESARILYCTQDEYERVGRDKYKEMREAGTGTIETRWKRRDGTVIDVLLSSTPLDPRNDRAGVTFTALDITQRKHAIEALARNEHLLRTIIDSTNDAMISIDATGAICLFNPAAETMFGWKKREMLGKTLDVLMPDPLRTQHEEFVQNYFATGKPDGAIGRTCEVTALRKDGTEFPIAISLSAARCNDEKLVIAIVRDITERKRNERRILEYQTKLKKLTSELVLAQERERRRIAVGVHDQIGQKMALVKLQTQSVMAGVANEDVVTSLNNTCELMDQVVQDAHSLTFELSNPVLYEIGLDAAIESWLGQHVEHGSKLKYSVSSNPTPLRPDIKLRVILFTVVRELLANVIKYASATRLTVHMEHRGAVVGVEVEDNGVGFDPAQLDRSVTKSGGFGLFHAQERIEYLGGTFTIDSSPGKGTRIRIEVPLRQDVVS